MDSKLVPQSNQLAHGARYWVDKRFFVKELQ